MAPCQWTLLLFLLPAIWATREHRRLIKNLLSDYDHVVRPVTHSSHVTSVSIRVTLEQIRDVDEKNQFLTTNVWLRFFWRDEFLTWNASQYGGINRLHIKSSMIWLPDIILYNSVDEERTAVELLSDTNVEVGPDGTVSWTTPAMFKSACKIEVDDYPFDIQKCPLKFGSWTYHGLEINVTSFTTAVLMDNYISNGEWEVMEAPCVRNEVYYSCCKEPYPDVTCDMVIRRRPLFYIYNLVFPCFLLIMIGALVFCLPPESGEKVSLAMTVLLAMTVFMLVVMENIPPTSEVVPLLEQFIGATIALLSLSVFTSIWVLNYYYRGDGVRRPPALLRKIFLECLAPVVFWNHETRNCNKQKAAKKKRREKNHMCVTGNSSTKVVRTPSPLEPLESLVPNDHVQVSISPGSPVQQTPNLNNNNEVVDVLKAILLRLDSIGDRLVHGKRAVNAPEVEVDVRVRQEWRAVATTLDRVFFILFLFLAIVMALGIFSQVPH